MKNSWMLVPTLLAAVSLVGVFAAPTSFGLGLFGHAGYVGGAAESGLGITAKLPPPVPLTGYLTYNVANGGLGLALDYWVLNSEISGPFSWYFGFGGFFDLFINNKNSSVDFGLRFPVGIQFFPVSKCEIFLEAVPSVPLLPTPSIGFGADLGFRFYM
jgi:hypothetical protein